MRRVIIESPFAGPSPEVVEEHIRYARACVKDALLRGEAPLASHLLYTQPGILDDTVPEERARGIEAGVEWYKAAEACVVYVDCGMSKGMEYGIARAEKTGLLVEFRRVSGWQPRVLPVNPPVFMPPRAKAPPAP